MFRIILSGIAGMILVQLMFYVMFACPAVIFMMLLVGGIIGGAQMFM